MNVIETNDLTKKFGELVAVDGINLEVKKGSIHGFVGPNGAGKTTTMRMLVGTLNPTEGEAYIKGEKAGSIEAKEVIGYSPQQPKFYESMSGLGYLEYMGELGGMGSEARNRAEELLEWLDLADSMDKKIGEYSGGMQRRLSLAQAMIHDPELLILDEPTATLDPAGRMAIIDSLEKFTKEGMTVFVSSHVLSELEKFIDTVTILRDGGLITTSSLKDLADTYASEAYTLSTSNNERILEAMENKPYISQAFSEDQDLVSVLASDPDKFKTELVDILSEEKIRLDQFKREGGLEDAFIRAIEEGGN